MTGNKERIIFQRQPTDIWKLRSHIVISQIPCVWLIAGALVEAEKNGRGQNNFRMREWPAMIAGKSERHSIDENWL